MTHPVVDRRGLVLRAVDAVPGAHLRNLQRITRLAWGTLRYHAGTLVDQGAILAEADRRFLRYYPAPMPVQARRTWDAVRSRQTRLIVEALLAHPCSQATLALRLGQAPSTTHRHVARLRTLGVLVETAGTLRLTWPQDAQHLLATRNPTLLDRLSDGAITLFDQLEG